MKQAAKVTPPDDARDEHDPTASSQVLELQRSAGNSAVSGLLADEQGGDGHVLPARLVQRAAAAPAATEAPGKRETLEIPEVTREHMRADVERIVALLQKQILWSSEEAEIVQMVFHWTEVDRLNLETGHSDTRNIDEFLLLLKKRAFPRATARSAWQETWVNAYDTLWYELEDDNLQRFAQLVATSRKQATAGPEGEHTENFWSTLGKQEALGVWGTLKGMGLTLSGLADAAIWWQWKVSGLPLRTVLDALGVKLGSEPPQLSPWLEKQYDVVAKEMGHAFGIDPTKDETLLGQSSYEIGEFGGKIVGALTLAGAGEAGGAAEGVQAGLKGLQLAQAFQGIDQSVQKIVDRIIEIREARPSATWDEILLDAKVLVEVANILVALMSVFGSFDDAAPTFTEAFKKMKLPVALVSIAPLIQKAWIDYNDPKLASDKEARDKALRDDVAAIMSAVAVLVGTSVGGQSEGKESGGKDGGGGGDGEQAGSGSTEVEVVSSAGSGQETAPVPEAHQQLPPEAPMELQTTLESLGDLQAAEKWSQQNAIELPPEAPLELQGALESSSDLQAGWEGRNDGAAIELPPEGGALELQSSLETTQEQQQQFDQSKAGADQRARQEEFRRGRTDRRWLLTRQDEMNYVQYSPDVNRRAEWRARWRFEPPQGGGTVRFGAREYTYDAAGNLVQATSTEVALGVRDPTMYANAPGVTPGTDYGHLLGVDFGHIDAQLGRHGGTAMTPDINRPLGQIDAAWYNAERAAVARALQLQEAGTPFRVVAEARGHDANGVAAATRLRIEVNGVPNFDSGWIGNPASANFQQPQ